MAKVVPPFFGVNNRSMYTVPIGPVVSGMKQLRGQAKAAVKASVTPVSVGSTRLPNGKRVKKVAP